jgi:cytochrome c oxidase subunit II
MLRLLGLPVEASAHAAEIDHMIVLVHWLMLVLLVGWGGFFAVALFKFRRRRHPVANYAGATGHVSRYVEIGVAVVEAVLLAGYAIPAWARRVQPPPPEDTAVVVRVVGEQFAWNIHYPGPDGKFGRTSPDLVSVSNPLGLDRNDPDARDDITTVNQLNLPIGQTVLIHLSSKDVIHSFGVYEMRVKQDAIPGLSVPVWFTPTREGKYEITCSQLCGLAHYRMRGFVTVQSRQAFESWLADQEKALAQ